MRTLILDGLFVYKNLDKTFNGKSSLEIIFEKSKENKFERYVLIQNGNIKSIPDGIKNVIVTEKNPFNILKTIVDEAKNSDDIVVFDAANPFYDTNYIEDMLKRHNSYMSDYTYGIGFPEGLLPTIVNKDILKEMTRLVENDDVIKKDYLYYTLSKDINAFDIETFLSDDDLRVYRIKFGLNDEGEELFTDKMFENFGSNFTVKSLCEYLTKNPDSTYTIPYMIDLELTNQSPIKSIYLPENAERKSELSFELAKKIISSGKKINHDIRIILGGIGDPVSSKDFLKILEFISNENINCVVETTGSGINAGFVEKINNFNKEKIIFVVKLDCYDEPTYKIIHPDGNFSGTQEAIKLLKDTGFKTYKQVVRIHENEVEIEKYVRNKEAEDLIVKKFSTFCKTLPDKKVVDLSPLERIPCFHLRREIYVKSTGEVTFCMFSLNEKIGDFNKEEIGSIIEKLKKAYEENAKCNYKDFCKSCDDYYLFNF
jgi:spiro-SPASM protein